MELTTAMKNPNLRKFFKEQENELYGNYSVNLIRKLNELGYLTEEQTLEALDLCYKEQVALFRDVEEGNEMVWIGDKRQTVVSGDKFESMKPLFQIIYRLDNRKILFVDYETALAEGDPIPYDPN